MVCWWKHSFILKTCSCQPHIHAQVCVHPHVQAYRWHSHMHKWALSCTQTRGKTVPAELKKKKKNNDKRSPQCSFLAFFQWGKLHAERWVQAPPGLQRQPRVSVLLHRGWRANGGRCPGWCWNFFILSTLSELFYCNRRNFRSRKNFVL